MLKSAPINNAHLDACHTFVARYRCSTNKELSGANMDTKCFFSKVNLGLTKIASKSAKRWKGAVGFSFDQVSTFCGHVWRPIDVRYRVETKYSIFFPPCRIIHLQVALDRHFDHDDHQQKRICQRQSSIFGNASRGCGTPSLPSSTFLPKRNYGQVASVCQTLQFDHSAEEVVGQMDDDWFFSWPPVKNWSVHIEEYTDFPVL